MTDTTKVKVRFTTIKFFNEETGEVNENTIMGKLTMADCKKFLKENIADKTVFISKSPAVETIKVDTAALYALKIEEPETETESDSE